MSIYDEIAAERIRAHRKHGATSMESAPVGAERRLRILVEEVGEVAREFNDAEHRGGLHTLDLGKLRAELIQTAAMAAAWVAAIDGDSLAEVCRNCHGRGWITLPVTVATAETCSVPATRTTWFVQCPDCTPSPPASSFVGRTS